MTPTCGMCPFCLEPLADHSVAEYESCRVDLQRAGSDDFLPARSRPLGPVDSHPTPQQKEET
jgi:hypothetical protein